MPGLPSKDELIAWIRDNPDQAGKREIVRAFGIKGADRTELKRMLRELQDAGEIERRRRRVRPAGMLPPAGVLKVTSVDDDGVVQAEPANWNEPDAPPSIQILPRKRDAFGPGDRVLCKLTARAGSYEARPIRKLERSERRMLGIFREGPRGGRIEPVDKRAAREWSVPAGETGGAEDGDLVEADEIPGARQGLPRGRIVARHGDPQAAGQISLIAMVEHGIPLQFPAEVLAEGKAAQPVGLGKREDLRDLPLITIDPIDARDHDDAVCAMPDADPKNEGGHIVWVAIADVAHYVRPGSALDAEARGARQFQLFPGSGQPDAAGRACRPIFVP